ncbi:MAG TPA: AraC family transcriptional regulator, partial [Erysipelothrix sp.]|nr:AraC family transcriptional regulator [Erysipelothrix sp.]
MYLKTTNPQFLRYGRVIDHPSDYKRESFHLEDKTLDNLFVHDYEVEVAILEGIGILVIQTEEGTLEQFVIHRIPVIKANVPFKIISITSAVVVEMSYYTDETVNPKEVLVPGKRSYESITKSFEVSNIYSYYYNVKGKGYHFDGE